ncbi:nucleolysin TIAR isoform X4 [Cherax quadricarinatus]|uniref:nucleolysin TIAR isoform X4 n=1 Tax=Cherax quadricarinatus TaxID=27406 RepID=UPI002378E38F|nr:nucleolysin TIAR-like isoform X2 [Cherax quadricarinatus]
MLEARGDSNMAHSEQNRTLYVGNLDSTVTEDLIMMLFGQLGEVRSCKMFREPTTDPYCFVEFCDHMTALNAITMMNDKMLQSRKMRVDWATGQGNKNKYTKVDTSRHHHVYVGDLSPEIDEQALREAFQVFGEISDCKVVKDPQSFKSRGYGFVVFVKKMDAETSISAMNGQWLGRKMIKTRWATRKPANTPSENKPEQKKLNYEEVYNQTTPTNTTVFCGGLKQDISEEMLHKSFQPHGQIEKIKIFKEKGYAFIKYTSKESACQAIVELHNSNLNGQIIRCSWGKDTGVDQVNNPAQDANGAQPSMPSYPNGGGYPSQMGQMGYWQYYPQQMPYNQMPYNQYAYGYQPNPGYMWMGWGQQGWGQPGQPGPPAPQQGQPQQ